jgi:hypothetical protein
MTLAMGVFTLTNFRLIYMLDYCEQALHVTESSYDWKPQPSTGIAYPFSCIKPEPRSYANTLAYQLNNEYQKGLILCNDRLTELNLEPVTSID